MFIEKEIKSILEAINRFYEDRFPLNEMSNYSGRELGLPVNIWIDGPRNLKHSKRIKVQNNYSNRFHEEDLITLTISENPQLGRTFKKVRISAKDLDKVKSWIVLNKDLLLEYAEGNMSTRELDSRLKSI